MDTETPAPPTFWFDAVPVPEPGADAATWAAYADALTATLTAPAAS